MAANPKTAKVVGSVQIAPHTRLIDLALAEGGPLGFRGGQYLIVNTGVVLEGGKPAKRAYSLLSADTEQERVQIAVKQLEPGPGSSAMHAAAIGAELSFSGPWGKLAPEVEAASAPGAARSTSEAASVGRALVFCTDTGITAGLGLMTAAAFAPFVKDAALVWYVEPGSFVPEAFVRERLATVGATLHVERALAVKHPERAAHAGAIVDRIVSERGLPAMAFLTGDGDVIVPMQAALVGAGVREDRARIEAFFHNPARKAPG